MTLEIRQQIVNRSKKLKEQYLRLVRLDTDVVWAGGDSRLLGEQLDNIMKRFMSDYSKGSRQGQD